MRQRLTNISLKIQHLGFHVCQSLLPGTIGDNFSNILHEHDGDVIRAARIEDEGHLALVRLEVPDQARLLDELALRDGARHLVCDG